MKLFKVLCFLLISSFVYSQGIEPFQIQGTDYRGGFLRGDVTKVWDDALQDSVYLYVHYPDSFYLDSLIFVDDSECYTDSIQLRQGSGFIPLYDNDVSQIYIHAGGMEEYGQSPEDLQVNFETYTLNYWDCGTWEFMFNIARRVVNGYGINSTLNTSDFADEYYTFDVDTSLITTKYYVDSLVSVSGGGGVSGSGAANKVAYWQNSDTLTYDTAFHYNATSKILGVGITSPTGTGSTVHVHGSTFSTAHLTNSSTGTTSGDGTRIYTYADSLYISNQEDGNLELGTNNVTRLKINPTGNIYIPALDTDGTAPTTTGTTKKVVSDAAGILSFQDNNTGTVTSVGLTTGTSGTDINVSGSPVTSSGTITLNIPTASGSNTGKLSSTDWTTFNNKIGSLNGLTAATQTFAETNSGADFTISSTGSTHTFNLPFEGSSTGIRLGESAKLTDNCVMLGARAGENLTGINNVGIGYAAVKGATAATATNNVGIGYGSLTAISSGVNNVGVGSYSLYNLTTGSYNFGMGESAMLTNSTGSNNVGIGRWALRLNTNSNNVAIGTYAFRTTTGESNIGIGSSAGELNTGSSNVFIGRNSGASSSTTSSSVFIGDAAGLTTVRNNTLIINNSSGTPLIGGHFDNDRLGINTDISSIARTLHVTGEMRVTDLTTDTPTKIVGADGDGDFGALSHGNGVTVSSGSVGLTGQALALHNLGTNGLIARTASGTVAARTIENGQGVLVTNGDGVSGNPSLFNVVCSHGQLYNTGNLIAQTLDGTAREIDFTSSYSNNMTLSTANNTITIPATGTYEITYSFSYSLDVASTHTIYFELYENSADYGYNGQTRSRETTTSAVSPELFQVSRSIIGNFTSADVLELYYRQFSGTATEINFYNLNFTAKRLK